MHNLLSYNQLSEWKKFEQTVDMCNSKDQAINDYFECLIECDDSQSSCKKICKRILSDSSLKGALI